MFEPDADTRGRLPVRIARDDPAAAVDFVRNAPLPGWPVPEAARHRDPNGLLEQAVRQWFEVHVRRPQRWWPLGLPSVAVENCWTAMAESADYPTFCRTALGEPLPVAHRPTRMPRTWEAACRAERIDAGRPTHLPVLFVVDQALQVPGGRLYTSRCSGRVCRVELPEVCVRHAFAPPRFWSFYRDDSANPRPT